jgi:hypothetical protein
MNTRITAGIIVQATSVVCPSNTNRLTFWLIVNVNIMYATTTAIIRIIINARS